MYYLSTIYISQNKLKESEELLLKLISLREEYLDAYKTLAVCLMRQSRPSEVLNYAEK